MLDPIKVQQYKAFCDSLKDSLSGFEAWEAVQSGAYPSSALAVQVIQRLKGEAPVVTPSAPRGVVENTSVGKGTLEGRKCNWGAVRDRALEALKSGPQRCNEVVETVIELSPQDQRPEGSEEKKSHYTSVFNALTAMINNQFVIKELREQGDKKVPFWSITEKGRAYLVELGR